MKQFKSIKKWLVGSVLLIALLFALLLIINMNIFDETLDDELVQQLAPVQMPDYNKNAYFALWGLSASNDKDIVDVGKRLIDRYRENINQRELDEITADDYAEILDSRGLDQTWKESMPGCVARKNQDCTSQLASMLNDPNSPISQALTNERLSVMRARYRQIIKMNRYQSIDLLTFASPLPPYGTLIKLSQLELSVAYQSQTPEVFLSTVEKDLSFWKLLLSQGDTLLDKMVAIARIWSDVHALSEYVDKVESFNDQQTDRINQILVPLSREQLDISEAFIFEQRAFYSTLDNPHPEELAAAYGLSARPIFWLVQPHATLNDYHQYFIKPIIKLNQLSPSQLYTTIENAKREGKSCCFEPIKNQVGFKLSSVYNLGGKLLLSDSLFNPEDYIARVHDLNGMLDLVRLKLSLKNDSGDVAAMIRQSKIINQYTGKPMDYDSKENSLKFECLNRNSVCSVKL